MRRFFFVLCASCSSSDPTLVPTSGNAPPATASDAATTTTGDAGSPSSSDGAATSDTASPGMPPTPTASGCKDVGHDTAKVENSAADTYTWFDRACRPRTAAFFRNDAKDAFGENGGYLRSLSYEQNGKTRSCKGTGANGWQGFGYIINHFANGASQTQGVAGSTTVVLAGKHHVVHQFKWRVSPGGPVDAVAQWQVSTGRDHPLFSITFDATPAGKNAVNADTRAPYGDMAFEGGSAGAISGIGWGDAYRFTTTGNGPVTPSTPWDYSKPNTIPYDLSWSNAADAEMGLVATNDFKSGMSAGDYGGPIAQRWGKSGSALLTDLPDWSWPYQLNQYELPFSTTSHRVAWGANYGAVGQASYASFGRTLGGYPTTSYAVEVIFGSHQSSAVMAAVSEMETVMKTKVAGGSWDPLRAAWTLATSNGKASAAFDTGGPTLVNPLLIVSQWTAGDPKVAWNGTPLTADVHYFATVDTARKELWITLGFGVTQGSLEITQ